MKTFDKFLMLITAATLFAAGCVNEDPAYKNEKPVPPTPQSGFLALGEMSMRVVYDVENDADDTGDETQRPASRATRTQPDVDQFWVELFDPQDVSIFKKKYADLKVDLAEEAMELPVATYRLEVYSDEVIPDLAWDAPTYGATRELTLKKGITTTIEEVVCTLSNIKVTMMCSVDLAERLNIDKTTATISLGETKAVFGVAETTPRAAYFKAPELQNTIKFLLQGEFTDGKPVKFSKTINNVKAGQWRNISLVIEYADKGDIKLGVVVEGFEQDEEIVVDGTSGTNGWEPIYDEPVIDPSAPEITWPDHDLTQPFQITASMFDEQGNCIEPFKLDVKSPNGIETFMIDITSTNADFTSALTAIGIVGQIDLCNFDVSSPAYSILGDTFNFPMNENLKGKKRADFDLGKAIPMLYMFEGKHTFALTVTDINGETCQIQLVLLVDKANESGAPRIEWVGYDLEQIHTLQADMTIEVNVTATAGIKSFVVEIDSEVLKGMLTGINMDRLTSPFDLCTIEDPEKSFLSNTVGFKTGDQVKNQTSVSFDINQFVSVLMTLGQPGERYNFRFEVTDNNDKTTLGAIQLVRATE